MIKIWIALIALSGILVFQHSQDLNIRNTHTSTELTTKLPSHYNTQLLKTAVEKATKKDTVYAIAVNRKLNNEYSVERPWVIPDKKSEQMKTELRLLDGVLFT